MPMYLELRLALLEGIILLVLNELGRGHGFRMVPGMIDPAAQLITTERKREITMKYHLYIFFHLLSVHVSQDAQSKPLCLTKLSMPLLRQTPFFISCAMSRTS